MNFRSTQISGGNLGKNDSTFKLTEFKEVIVMHLLYLDFEVRSFQNFLSVVFLNLSLGNHGYRISSKMELEIVFLSRIIDDTDE